MAEAVGPGRPDGPAAVFVQPGPPSRRLAIRFETHYEQDSCTVLA